MVRKVKSGELVLFDGLADDRTPNCVGDDLTPDELSYVSDELRPKLSRARGQMIHHAYAIGSTLVESLRGVAEGRKKGNKTAYPAGSFRAIASCLQHQGYPVDEKFLQTCCRIVETIGPDELQELVAMESITMGHICLLANVCDADRRKLLARQTASERLSIRELRSEVKGITGPQRGPGAGRPPKISKNITAALQHIRGTAKQWHNLVDHSWFGDRFDAATEIARVPPKQWTTDRRAQVVETIEALRQMAEAAAEKAAILQETLDKIDAVVAGEGGEAATSCESVSAAGAEEAVS
jgi:hypothetical protein